MEDAVRGPACTNLGAWVLEDVQLSNLSPVTAPRHGAGSFQRTGPPVATTGQVRGVTGLGLLAGSTRTARFNVISDSLMSQGCSPLAFGTV